MVRTAATTAAASLLAVLAALSTETAAFSNGHQRQSRIIISTAPTTRQFAPRAASAGRLSLRSNDNDDDDDDQISTTAKNKNDILKPILSTITTASLALALATAPLPLLLANPQASYAYEESDYASETVTAVVSQLKSSAGDADATFNTFEELGKIITEGKGVGGTLTYDGVKLNEGVFVGDEDTTIYNPGLSLLTSSEKERLVQGIIDNRKVGLSTKHWSENNEYAFDFLKTKLDPLHMHELSGYLGILPFYGGALYLAAIFVQKNARGIFPLAYGLCALGVFGPVFLLVLTGP